MKVVIYEYASTGIAVLSTLGFLVAVEQLFLGTDGFFAQLIKLVVGGG